MQIKLIQVNQDKSSQQIIAIIYFLFSFFFGHTKQHVGSQFPDQGLNPCPCKWKLGVRTIALPGKFQQSLFKLHKHDLHRSCGKRATAVLLLSLKKENKIQSLNNIMPKMSNKCPKISRFSKRKENVTYDWEKYVRPLFKLVSFYLGMTVVNFY